MRTPTRACLVVVLVSVLRVSAAHAAPILTLNPVGGAMSGTPGSTIGWGFTLSQDDYYAVITSADFCGAIISSPCSTPLGFFTDFIAQYNFTFLDPFSSVSAVFDPVNLTGIGSYTIAAGASAGTTFLGNILLTYDLYADGLGETLISTDNQLMAAASVTVSAPAPVPEPATWVLLSSGAIGLCIDRRRRRHRRCRARRAFTSQRP